MVYTSIEPSILTNFSCLSLSDPTEINKLDILIVDKHFALKHVVPKPAKIMNPDFLWNAAFPKCLANTAH